jgi:hypothetical protein
MMFYQQQGAMSYTSVQDASAQSNFVNFRSGYPAAPFAVGVAPHAYVPIQQHYNNPTMVPHTPVQGGGYYPQPSAMPINAATSAPVMKRHNPYAPGGASVSSHPSMGSHEDFSYSAMESPLMSYSTTTDFTNYGHADVSNDSLSMMSHQKGNNAGNNNSQHQVVTTEELLSHCGNLVELSRTAPGSSFIQAALREGSPSLPQNVNIIFNELQPAASSLLLDAHGCYVVKTLMERLTNEQLEAFVGSITADPQLVYAMCTHSLHTRRVVQFLMDNVNVAPVAEVLIQRCSEVSMTQQGCIIMQRAMDVTPEPLRAQLFSTIFDHLVEFSVDPFANYVVQHMLEIGDKVLCSSAILRAFRGNIVRLACNKFSSNVLEKSLFHITPDAQHDLLHEMYEVDEEVLHSMMQDSFGNYLIQSSIALATFKDVIYINDRLKHVLQRTPYGHKIELRIERRMKGRPVGTRSSQIGANSKTSRHQRGSQRETSDQQEEPW